MTHRGLDRALDATGFHLPFNSILQRTKGKEPDKDNNEHGSEEYRHAKKRLKQALLEFYR